MLDSIGLFSSLSKDELSTLWLFCQERELFKWEILFSEGEDSSSMYILVSWTLEVFTFERFLWTVKPGEVVWEMSIFSWKNIRSATVRALENSQLIVLLAFSIEDLSRKHPEIMLKIKDIIQKRVFQNSLV
jgi:CRP-like cAMP-binding protein